MHQQTCLAALPVLCQGLATHPLPVQVPSVWAIGDVTDRMALTPGPQQLSFMAMNDPAVLGVECISRCKRLSGKPTLRAFVATAVLPFNSNCSCPDGGVAAPSCISNPLFVSAPAVALMEAMALTKTIFGGQPTKPDHENVPTAVFSHPQIATVGMSEEQVGARVLHFSRLAACSCAVFSHFLIVAVGMSKEQVWGAS